MWKLILTRLRKKRKKNYKPVNVSHSILPDFLQKEFMKSRKDKVVVVLLEVFSSQDRQSLQLSFKDTWRNMDRVDKIESLISIEKEISGMRKELCKEIAQMSKGKL